MRYNQAVAAIMCMHVLLSALATEAAVPRAQRATGNTSTSQSSVDATIHVKPDGDDNLDGLSFANAVQTVAKGAALAEPYLQQGTATKISINPGVYREGNIAINADQIGGAARSTLLIIEGTAKGEVVISGSVTEGWEPSTWTLFDEEHLVYEHAWPYSWGPAGYPSATDPYPELLQRREMVLVNGKLMKQWLKLVVGVDGTLLPNSFFADEDAGKIYLRLEQPLMSGDRIEVADKEILMKLEPKENLVLRNLTFTHANSYVWSNDIWGRAVAVTPSGGPDVLIEDCAFVWNNGTGANLGRGNAATVRRCRFSNNGWKGMDISGGNNVLVESCRADSNSWRQVWSHHLGLDAAGVKVTVSDRVTFYKDTCFWNNPSEGIWFDFDNRNMFFDQCLLPAAPHGAPIFIEASPGPLTIVNCEVGMISIVGAKDVTIDSCTLTQPIAVGEQDRRNVRGWTAINENFRIYNNTMQIDAAAIDAGLPLDLWPVLFQSLDSDYNTWISGGVEECFRDESFERITFLQWQVLGKDLHSVFLDNSVIQRSHFVRSDGLHSQADRNPTMFSLNGRFLRLKAHGSHRTKKPVLSRGPTEALAPGIFVLVKDKR